MRLWAGSTSLIGIGGQNRERLEICTGRLSILGAPPFPKPRKGEGFAAFQAECEWLPGFGVALGPFVKSVGGNEASPLTQSFTESRLIRGLFRPSIDRGEADFRVFGPGRHQPPAEQRKLPGSSFGARTYDWLHTLRCNVVTGRESRKIFQVDSEPIGKNLACRPARKSSAHKGNDTSDAVVRTSPARR